VRYHATRYAAALSLLALLCSTSCADDAPTEAPAPDRCTSSDGCDDGEVCRDRLCVTAPECSTALECEAGESCLGGICAYDASLCTDDTACDDGEICDGGGCRPGCRIDRDCDDTHACSDELLCVMRPCTELGCEDGYACDADSGDCELLPCNGGCTPPLQCREEDEVCVTCLEHAECAPTEACGSDGECAALPCEAHAECPEGAYCVNQLCQLPPPCDDDSLEPNNDAANATSRDFGLHTDLVVCPFDSDYYSIVADEGRSLSVEVVPDVASLRVELFNPVDVLFGRRDVAVAEGAVLTVNLGSTGAYTVRVSQIDEDQGVVGYAMALSTGPLVEPEPDICRSDSWEPNDDSDGATDIFTGRWTGLSVCRGDADWYAIGAEGGELLGACLTPPDGNAVELELALLRSNGDRLASEQGVSELCLEEDLLDSDEYRVRVMAVDGTSEATYHITFELEPGCLLFEDEWDERDANDALPGLVGPPLEAIPSEDLPIDLQVCPRDSDYWPVALELGDELSASITFVHADGDLQLRLHRPDGSVRVASSGIGDEESLVVVAEETGVHHLRVWGEGDAMGPYTLDYTIE